MKKNKIIILSIIFIILFIFIICMVNKKNNKEESTIPEYTSDIKCTLKTTEENTSGEEVSYISNIYLDIDNNYVTNAIIQSIETGTSMADADVALMEPLMDDYNDLTGIKASIKIIGDYIVTTVKYDYTSIDLDEIRTSLSNILTEDSIFNKVDKFPITLDKYKEYMLDGYTCN